MIFCLTLVTRAPPCKELRLLHSCSGCDKPFPCNRINIRVKRKSVKAWFILESDLPNLLDVDWVFFQSCIPASLPNLQEITMFYYLPQGWPLYQEIDTLFRRITWRQPVHCQLLQGPVTDRLGLTMHKHELLYKWLLARRRQGGCRPWTSCLTAPQASVSLSSPYLLGSTMFLGVSHYASWYPNHWSNSIS